MTFSELQLNHNSKFLLTCLLRGMTGYIHTIRAHHKFLLTCLLRGMTDHIRKQKYKAGISTHMPLARHDVVVDLWYITVWFLLTCLLRGMTYSCISPGRCKGFLLTCLLRGMTLRWHNLYCCRLFLLTCLLRGMTPGSRNLIPGSTISTHMPLARHDYTSQWFANFFLDFYSHASCEAWRRNIDGELQILRFLLTCLLRGMTGTSVR